MHFSIASPGVQIQDSRLLQNIKARLSQLLHSNYPINSFPGSQPVSFVGSQHTDSLLQQDYYVCEKSDGIRYLLLAIRTREGQPMTLLINRRYEIYQIEGIALVQRHDPRLCHHETLLDGELIEEEPEGHQPLQTHSTLLESKAQQISNDNDSDANQLRAKQTEEDGINDIGHQASKNDSMRALSDVQTQRCTVKDAEESQELSNEDVSSVDSSNYTANEHNKEVANDKSVAISNEKPEFKTSNLLDHSESNMSDSQKAAVPQEGKHKLQDHHLEANQDMTNQSRAIKFVIFDAMLINGKNICNESLLERLNHVQKEVINPYERIQQQQQQQHQLDKRRKVDHHANGQVYSLSTAPSHQHRIALSIKKMYKPYAISELLDKVIPSQKHGNDGLIFTPVHLPYRLGTCRHMYKWKPAELNSVDFLVRVIQKNKNTDSRRQSHSEGDCFHSQANDAISSGEDNNGAEKPSQLLKDTRTQNNTALCSTD